MGWAGGAREPLSQEWSETSGQTGTAPQEPLWGKRRHREIGEMSSGTAGLQGQISEFMAERKALIFVPSLPSGQQRANAFVIPEQHWQKKVLTKPFAQILSGFKLCVSVPEYEHWV